MRESNFFKRFFNLFFISIFILFFANSALLLYLSNKDLSTAGIEYYNQKAEIICQKLDDSVLTPLSRMVFDQFGSFQNSSMMNFLIYDKSQEGASNLTREIANEIVQNEWLRSIIVYREDGAIVTDQRMRRSAENFFTATQLQGIINGIIKKTSSSGWLSPELLNSANEKSLIYFIKYPITDTSRNRGIILYMVSASFLENKIRNIIDPTVARFMIEDETSQILFSYGSTTIPAWVNATRPENIETTALWKGSDKKWQVIWKPLPNQRISTALVVSSSIFQRNLFYSQRLNIALTLLFILGIASYLFFVNNHVQHPLAKIMDSLRSMVHGQPTRKHAFDFDTEKMVDENKHLIAYRFIINLVTEGLSREDFAHIYEILGLRNSSSTFHVILIEHDPVPLKCLSWEERELREESLQQQWDLLMPSERTLSIRYPAGGIICLFFVDSTFTLPVGAMFRYAQKIHSNFVFSEACEETAEFPHIYRDLVQVLDKKLYCGYGNVFYHEGTQTCAWKTFSMDQLKGYLVGDKYQDFKTALVKNLTKMEQESFPPVMIRDYFVHISELINEMYQKKAKNKESIELSHVIMREEVQQLSGIAEFLEWTDNKIRLLQDSVQNSSDENNRELIAEIREFISQSIDRNITQEIVAQRFGISSGYLSRLFKEHSPEGFSAYLKECKLRKAARLIREKQCDSIADLSQRLGYSSTAYFSRQFKKRFVLLPHDYAKCPERVLE